MQGLKWLIDYALNSHYDILTDEIHFLYECPAFSTSREHLMECKNFIGLNLKKYL